MRINSYVKFIHYVERFKRRGREGGWSVAKYAVAYELRARSNLFGTNKVFTGFEAKVRLICDSNRGSKFVSNVDFALNT